jgi:acyl-CoA synthetase (AMP-forming)/AMP-acid ligase II
MTRPDDHADLAPEAAAVIVPATGQRISYRAMVDQSKRLANVLRGSGLKPGDHVAIFMTNVPEYFEVVWAARRAGYFYTAVSWHLTPAEVRYMLENSESKALIASADLADVAEQAAAGLPRLTLRLLAGGDAVRPGWDDYAATVAKAGTHPLGPELEGQAMLYSSGTTGRPKGIVHAGIDTARRFGDVAGDILWANRYGLDQSTVTLNVGPLYHAAPLVSAMSTHRIGHLDDDGYLFITGRSDHTIISGGVNIYPREIEDLLIGHTAVDDVAVIGVPDDEYGEAVKAVVTLREGYAGGDALERDIIAWTRARLAHYKCPRSVTFVGSLPRSVAGKMMKHRLIEQLKQESGT